MEINKKLNGNLVFKRGVFKIEFKKVLVFRIFL